MLNSFIKWWLKKIIISLVKNKMYYTDNSRNMFDNQDYLRHYNNNPNPYNHSFNRKKWWRGMINGRRILKIGHTVRDDVHKYIKWIKHKVHIEILRLNLFILSSLIVIIYTCKEIKKFIKSLEERV